MISYRVVVVPEAKEQFKDYLAYIVNHLMNVEAALAVADDYDETIAALENNAGSIKICDEPELARRKLRKIHFRRHNYIMLYRIKDDIAEVVKIYHTLEDYENKI